jgi:hypothetical protein
MFMYDFWTRPMRAPKGLEPMMRVLTKTPDSPHMCTRPNTRILAVLIAGTPGVASH